MNETLKSPAEYHWATKHVRDRIKPHYLDFENYPDQVKSYDFLMKQDLKKDDSRLKVDPMALFQEPKTGLQSSFGFKELSEALFLSYGVTRISYNNGVPFYFRSVPSAGALYPCHLYLLVDHLNGLETGLYYCNMIQEFVGMIQKGEIREKKCAPSFSLIITGEYFNSAWKYRERAFRYISLDSGHLIENVSVSLNAFKQSFSIQSSFDPDPISKLLSLSSSKEVPLACIAVGEKPSVSLSGPRAVHKKSLSNQKYYSLLSKVYDLGKEKNALKESNSQNQGIGINTKKEAINFIKGQGSIAKIDLHDTVSRRCSKRNFVKKELEQSKAFTLFNVAASLVQSKSGYGELLESNLVLGITCQNVQEMEDGFYIFAEDRSSLKLASKGNYQSTLSQVCLDQMWISNASINFLFMANLSETEDICGMQSYQELLKLSGRVGQRIYLAATFLGLGCCGIGAFYDEEAQDLFKLNNQSGLLYMVSAGPIKK